MNIILSIFLLIISIFLLYQYKKNSVTLIACSSQKERHKLWRENKNRIYYLLGLVVTILILTLYLINRQFEKLETQNQNLISRIESVDNKFSELKSLSENQIQKEELTKKFNDYSKEVIKDKKFSHLSELLWVVSVLALVWALYTRKKNVVYVSAITSILASSTSILTKSQLLKASLKLEPNFETNIDITLENKKDATHMVKYSYDTLLVKTFTSGFDTLEENNNLNSTIDYLKTSNHSYDNIELTGMVDQRGFGPTSSRIFETNRNLAKARARFVEKKIIENVSFKIKPKFDLKISEPNDFTLTLDPSILSTNRIVICICRYEIGK